MKANYPLCILASGAILLSQSFAQERSTDPASQSANAATLVTCSPDGEFFVMASAEGRITYARPSNGATLRIFYQCHPRAVEFSPDGRLLASVGAIKGSPAQIKVWKVDDGRLLGQWAVENGTDVRLHANSTEGKVATLPSPNLPPVTRGRALMFSPDGQWLLATKRNGESAAWNIITLRGELATNSAAVVSKDHP
jgi:WD40 repeat protein